jgi:ligand-binding sensor domain-containing protein
MITPFIKQNRMKFSAILLFSAVFFSGFLNSIYAQNLQIGQWRDHLPYNKCISIALSSTRSYSATESSLLYFDKTDNSISRKNKVNGLSDVGISSIAFSEEYNTLVVAYSNTNLDLIKGEEIINVPDIKRKQILGNKTINKIMIIGKYAYLSCGFGIVVLDIDREEIHDTYYIGPLGTQINVFDLTLNEANNKFYAATEKGIYSADASSNLAYFDNWIKETSISAPNAKFNLVVAFNGKVYANSTKSIWESDTLYVYNGNVWDYFLPGNHSNRANINVSNNRLLICQYLAVDVYKPDGSFDKNYYTYSPGNIRPNDALFDASGELWIADNDNGMWNIDNSYQSHQYLINGPLSARVAGMDISGNTLWAASGGRDASFGALYNPAQFCTFENESWTSFNGSNSTFLQSKADILCVAADPLDGNHAYLGSWGYGVFEMDNGEFVNNYLPTNSSLQSYNSDIGTCFVGGMAFDTDHNLWMTNSTVANVLSVKKNTGEWKSFNLKSYGTGVYTGGLVIDNANQKWMQMRDLSLLVFNDNNTLDITADDQVFKLNNAVGSGSLPGNGIASFAVDKEGQLWLGSDQGVAVIYSPENVFTQGNFDAQKVQIEEEGFLHPLLETEAVTAIAVNGNNEKWLGTDKSGVFLMAADGSQEIYHFTEENSPLLSNSITSIRIASDGEVFFGTGSGIVSYRDSSQPPSEELDSVYVYPNPVRENYSGPIAISNLVADANVKITDISGHLVWEIQSKGGLVTWDGNDLDGRRVKTGVYLVFVTNSDGSKKEVTKVLFINK